MCILFVRRYFPFLSAKNARSLLQSREKQKKKLTVLRRIEEEDGGGRANWRRRGETAVWCVRCPHQVGEVGVIRALSPSCLSVLPSGLEQRRVNLWLAEAPSDPSFYCSEGAKQTPARLPPPLLCRRRLRHPLCSAGTSHATISLSPSPHFSAAAKRQTRSPPCPSILSPPHPAAASPSPLLFAFSRLFPGSEADQPSRNL